MFGKLTSRHAILLGVLASVACLAYFYMLDRVIFSTRFFAPIFQFLLTVYDIDTAWLALAVSIVAALWQRSVPVLKVVDRLGAHPRTVIGGSVIALTICSLVVYHNYPLCMDEYAAVFQARIFAAGRMYAQLPASVIDWLVVPGFNGSFLVASRETGRAIEGYSPGFAILLAPFELLGIPWACNGLISGLVIYLVFQITWRLTGDRRAAGWAILFTISSGAFVAYGISYYSMQAHLAANLLFAYLLLRPTLARAFAAGLIGGLALVLHNPFPHTMFAAPWIVALAWNPPERRLLGPMLAGYLPGLCIFAGWMTFRGELTAVTFGVSSIGAAASGVFTLPDTELLNMRTASLVKLWLWAVPCLFLFAARGLHVYRDDRHVRLLAYSAVLTFLGYLLVPLDQGHGWGYRYFQSAWGVVPILAACGVAGRREPSARLLAFAGALSILSLAVIVPFQLAQMEGFIARHLAQIPPPKKPGNNVYFVAPGAGGYLADMIQIDPLLREPDLVLASRGAKLDEELVRQNWPGAIRVGDRSWAQQWYLGPEDRRLPRSAGTDPKRFAPTFEPAGGHE
jgi:hypothetical protein